MLLSLVKMSHPDCFCVSPKSVPQGLRVEDLKGKEQEKK